MAIAVQLFVTEPIGNLVVALVNLLVGVAFAALLFKPATAITGVEPVRALRTDTAKETCIRIAVHSECNYQKYTVRSSSTHAVVVHTQ